MVKVLIGKKEKYLVGKQKELNTSSGIIQIKKSFGLVKSHIGEKFLITEASIADVLQKLKRSAQVILPKDLGIIIAYTGVRPDWKILDAGTGSGFSSIFLANFVPSGKVYTYEKDKRFYKIAKQNLKKTEIKNVIIKNKDVTKLKEKNFDLALIDLQDVKKVLPVVFKALKPGGWLVVYSPTIDELITVQKIIKKMNTIEKRIMEVFVREWQYEKTLRPKTKGIVHTGFISLARKFG